MFRPLTIASLFFFIAAFAQSQTQSQAATLTFTLDFPGSQPDHYSLRVESGGKAQYESRSKLSDESEDEDSFKYDFTISPATAQKMFALAAKAGYFHKDLDSHRKNMAFTGKKTLAYQDAQRSGESTYNFSADAAVQQLTSLFQNLSATLEFGHRLEYDHRYQKTALEEELKRLEETAQSNMVIETAAIAPVLQQIVDDSTVMNVSRARAQRVLQKAGSR
jgi:hypothetical protein